MKRRQFLSVFMGVSAGLFTANHPILSRKPSVLDHLSAIAPFSEFEPSPYLSLLDPIVDREQPITIEQIASLGRASHKTNGMDDRDAHTMEDGDKKTAAQATKENKKSIDFAHDYDDDIFVSQEELPLLLSVTERLLRTQNTIGYGHFNVIGFDDALKFAKRYDSIGDFTKEELAFIDKVFTTRATDYGFYGEKVEASLTSVIKRKDIVKIPHSGHYIFKGESLAHYEKLTKDVGNSIILTSGIRSNVKQLYLFLAKTIQVGGNFSRASRSLAPPGYSFHGIGDFDVGRVGWGAKNFTDDFATTDEFKKMRDLGYIAIRYDHGNNLGVRFEPWHIKVV